MNGQAQEQHRWLHQLVGEWSFESEMPVDPADPSKKLAGKETVRSIGGLWVIGEGAGEMPDGQKGITILTIGFDPARGKFVGSFIASMMTHLWVYEGFLDAEGKVLTLEAQGPRFDQPGATALYRDRTEMEGPNVRLLRSLIQNPDGQWMEVMRMRYRRIG